MTTGVGGDGVHRTATAFSDAAGDYERARPDYPPEILSWLERHAGVGPRAVVLDLAAGTGKLTRGLVERGALVVAVEPVAGMRHAFRAALPGVPAVAGVAQALPVRSGTVDVVTVAQAFHWFATETAVRDVHRVLRRAGHLAVVWNRRDLGDPLQAALGRLMSPWRGSTPSHESGAWRRALEQGVGAELFAPEAEAHVPWRQLLDVEGVVARVASVSFVAALAAPERARLLDDVRAAAGAFPPPPALPYVADAYCYRRIP
jgi:SAM-dependent methyltransferase